MYFSVIVPVYGVEKYIRQCIDSILAQSFTDFELIIVDDGSPDRCPEICDEYAARDSRITVIHKENGGLVSARQAGISAADGEYIINIDSDDWIAEGYLQKAHDIFEEYAPDIISFAINYESEGGRRLSEEPVDEGFYNRIAIEREIFPKMLLTPDMKHMHYYICGKAFRRNAILRPQLEVDTAISNGEDVACLIPAYLSAKSVYISREPVYFCRCRPESMSRSFNPKYFKDAELLIRLLRRHEAEAPEGYSEAVDRYGAFSAFVLTVCAAESGSKSAVKEVKAGWNETVKDAVRRAEFEGITPKSRIAVGLMKRQMIGTVFYFLKLCAILKGGKRK